MQEVARIPFNKLVMVKGLEPFTSSAQAQQAASVLCSWLKIPLRELILLGYRFGQKLRKKKLGEKKIFSNISGRAGWLFNLFQKGLMLFTML